MAAGSLSSCISWEDPTRLDFVVGISVEREKRPTDFVQNKFQFCQTLYIGGTYNIMGEAYARITRPVLNNNVHRIVLGMLMFKNVFGKSRPERANSGNPSFHRVHELNSLASNVLLLRILLLCRSRAYSSAPRERNFESFELVYYILFILSYVFFYSHDVPFVRLICLSDCFD